MNRTRAIFLICLGMMSSSYAQNIYEIKTEHSSYILSGNLGESLLFQYYGPGINIQNNVNFEEIGLNREAYPAYGIHGEEEKALHVVHNDGNLSLKLLLEDVVETNDSPNVRTTCFKMKDEVYPFYVNIFYKAYYQENIIETWTEIYHKEKQDVKLVKYASAFLPVKCFNPVLTHFHGNWGNEFRLFEEELQRGMKTIKNKDGIRNTDRDNPSFMLSIDGPATENQGNIIAGTLAWTGNYAISFDRSLQNDINIVAGINESTGGWTLSKSERFVTPELVLTYSSRGKGQVSRNYHTWARKYKMLGGDELRPILLNSWEGVYMDIEEKVMFAMMDDFAELGGEMFVMDDGWFGNKYPRNSGSAGLGDWEPDRAKLPNGLQPLIEHARSQNLKFGIWVEPEMVNDKSELAIAHPDWIVHQDNRETIKGRGNSQMLLDMSNPRVQDFVFETIHKLLTNYPGIEYIKWDANHTMTNFGSSYLSAEKQSHIQIAYHRGIRSVLERIRKVHPDILMQACASGGGRVNYGYLPYFHEFWPSDNTDPVSRVYIQWGMSHFFPAIVTASHVSASPNHQTHRETPLKFRFDLAMTGRLGMEMMASTFTPQEKAFAMKAMENYKEIKPIIQFGDLYRIRSPYETGVSSLIYVDENKDEAVFFVFNLEKNLRQDYPSLKFDGLDPDKMYALEEMNCIRQPDFTPDKHVYPGEVLMNIGVPADLSRVYQSKVIRLVAQQKQE